MCSLEQILLSLGEVTLSFALPGGSGNDWSQSLLALFHFCIQIFVTELVDIFEPLLKNV